MGTDDTIAFRHTIGVDLMPLEETSLKWIFSGSKDGILCYSEGIDTVWDVNARNIAPAFLINTDILSRKKKKCAPSKTGNEAADGERHCFVKTIFVRNPVSCETSPLNAQVDWQTKFEKVNGLPIWPSVLSWQKQMVQFNTAVEIEIKEKYPDSASGPATDNDCIIYHFPY